MDMEFGWVDDGAELLRLVALVVEEDEDEDVVIVGGTITASQWSAGQSPGSSINEVRFLG